MLLVGQNSNLCEISEHLGLLLLACRRVYGRASFSFVFVINRRNALNFSKFMNSISPVLVSYQRDRLPCILHSLVSRGEGENVIIGGFELDMVHTWMPQSVVHWLYSVNQKPSCTCLLYSTRAHRSSIADALLLSKGGPVCFFNLLHPWYLCGVGEELPAVTASLLFTVHPVHVEVSASASVFLDHVNIFGRKNKAGHFDHTVIFRPSKQNNLRINSTLVGVADASYL